MIEGGLTRVGDEGCQIAYFLRVHREALPHHIVQSAMVIGHV